MKRNIIFLSLFLIFVSIICTTNSVAGPSTIHYPVVETVDLLVDGSITPQTISLTDDFHYVNRIGFVMIWEENSIDYDQFGNHTDELENGTLIYYNNSQIFNAITCIRCFTSFSYDIQILKDDKNPIENHLSARVSFNNFVEGGLDVRTYDLQFIVQDNNTLYASTFIVQIQGEKIIEVVDEKAPRPNLLDNINNFAIEFMKEPLWWVWLLIPLAAVVLIIRHWWK